jgi:putative ABC transport system permease protein
MFKFLVKGLFRDPSRSRFPVIIVSIGIFLVVFLQAFMMGMIKDMINVTAKMDSGHFKIMTRAYEELSSVIPNDLALMDVDMMLEDLREEYPDIVWTPRIRFGGLIDIPDEQGETRVQAPISGLGIDLLTAGSIELDNFNFADTSVLEGRMPQEPNEILLSAQFAEQAGVKIGDQATLVGATMYGSMAIHNFTVCGLVEFGISAMDKGSMIVDIEGIRQALDMENCAGEILGYYQDMNYSEHRDEAEAMRTAFNETYSDEKDEFSPIMLNFMDQNGMRSLMVTMDSAIYGMLFLFMLVMFIVLWNAGLLNGIRRYSEVGLRLAIGEEKKHLIRSMLLESLVVGFVGSVIGTLLGLGAAWYFQVYGLDVSYALDSSSIMFANVFRARITGQTLYIGFIPGLLATFLGTWMASRGIKKRQTAQLFKELEV